MDAQHLFDELLRVAEALGAVVRVELFETPVFRLALSSSIPGSVSHVGVMGLIAGDDRMARAKCETGQEGERPLDLTAGG